jgi:Ca-activated chloride channel family protein
MYFEWPVMLAGLAIVPLLWLYFRAQRRRAARMLDSNTGFGLPAGPAFGRALGARSTAWAFLLVGLSVLGISMARPQAVVSVPRVESTVMLAFDVSGSMAADDLKPNRMQAAKEAARAFVEAQPTGVRFGVVAFSDSGFTVQAPTYVREDVLAAIERLAPRRGTSLANGILVSLDTIAAERLPERVMYSALTPEPTQVPTPYPSGTYSSAAIILLSDGENTERADPLEAADAAAQRGVRIYTIGLGSPEGANLTVEGITVRTRLDEAALRALADVSGGQYFPAPSEKELQTIFGSLQPELILRDEPTELTAPFGVVGSLFLVVGALVSMLRSGGIA